MTSVLSGTRILDLSRVLAGPYGTLLMGDLGAEIIKIEDPKEGDPTRNITPKKIEGEDPYFRRCFGKEPQFDREFRETAREVFGPLLRQRKRIGR